MRYPSACEFSQTQFPIKNALDGSPIRREMPCQCSSIREGKLLQKTLKSRDNRNQRFSRPFFVAAGMIVGFESLESILDDEQ
jgi:hypothetical protein